MNCWNASGRSAPACAGGKGSISHEAAVKKVSDVYAEFRKKQDADYVSEFDRETVKYLKGTN